MAELGLPDAGRLTYGTGVVLGFVAHATGDEAQADALFVSTTAALDAAGIREMPGYYYQGDHVEAVLALGDIDRAEAIVADLEARARVFPRPWTLAVGARARGLVLAARGDLDGALAALEAALVHHERLESPYELGRTLLAKAHIHRRRTEKRLARDGFEAAVAQFDAAGAELWGRAPAPSSAGCASGPPVGSDRDGAADRRASRRGKDEPRDRGRDVRQPEDRRGSARQRLRQARDPVARRARRVDGLETEVVAGRPRRSYASAMTPIETRKPARRCSCGISVP